MVKENVEHDIFIAVTELTQHLGIPANLKGYYYLRTAILQASANSELLDGITKNLYPIVAKLHNSTVQRVERSIRNAIDTAWYRGGEKAICDFMGGNFGKPTNSEFIALAVDRIKMNFQL